MSPAENITRAYNGDWHGDWGAIPTPGHSKRDRGTTVRDGENGDVVFNSFNGGDWRGLKDECRERGLLLPLNQRNGRGGSSGGSWRDVAAFEYADADGTVLYRTVRREKAGERKKFVAQRPDGRGGWVNGMGDVERVLYLLPNIRAAMDRAASEKQAQPPVYLTEGERKADKLASWGFVATAVAFGAKGWRDTYAEALSGCTVVILPDNDDEGRAFADTAAASIRTAGGTAHIVPLPDLPLKGDVIDWKGTAADLRALTDSAIHKPGDSSPRLPLIDMKAWLGKTAPAPRYLLKDWLLKGTAALLVGEDGVGKSLLIQQLVTCLAMGLPFLGIPVTQVPALYITCEDDHDALWRRQEGINRVLGVRMEDVLQHVHLVSLVGEIDNELGTFDERNRLELSPRFRMIADTARSLGVGFVGLDNIAHQFPGDENKRKHVATFCSAVDRLAMDLDATCLMLGHPNKAGAEFSGSTGWSAHVRQRLWLERPTDEDGVVDEDARILKRSKSNHAKRGETVEFQWADWAFARASDLPVRRISGMGDPVSAQAAEDNDLFLACLRERLRQRRPVSERRSPTFAPTVFAKMPESKRIGRGRLEAAMDRLFRLGRIERATLWRDADKGRDVVGLRETPPNGTPQRSPERTSHNTPNGAENGSLPSPQPPQHTHLYTTYKGAGALESPPAPFSDDADNDLSDVADDRAASSDDDGLTDWTD